MSLAKGSTLGCVLSLVTYCFVSPPTTLAQTKTPSFCAGLSSLIPSDLRYVKISKFKLLNEFTLFHHSLDLSGKTARTLYNAAAIN